MKLACSARLAVGGPSTLGVRPTHCTVVAAIGVGRAGGPLAWGALVALGLGVHALGGRVLARGAVLARARCVGPRSVAPLARAAGLAGVLGGVGVGPGRALCADDLPRSADAAGSAVLAHTLGVVTTGTVLVLAIATLLATKCRKKVLLVSTDPAHALGDVWRTSFTNTPSSPLENLHVMELDPKQMMDSELESWLDYATSLDS